MTRPIVLFTDYGLQGPYVGQLKAAIWQRGFTGSVIDLMADAPVCDPQGSAYLLAALADYMPANAVMLCVIDPGVGTNRHAIVVDIDNRLFVGPDNGLFELVVRRAGHVAAWRIDWVPDTLSASFHGRDLFAPIAAGLAMGQSLQALGCSPMVWQAKPDWDDDWYRTVYIDGFGNVMSGIRASQIDPAAIVRVNGRDLTRARTFADSPVGQPFWYENSIGLLELAMNNGRANISLGITGSVPLEIRKNPDALADKKA